MRLISKRAFRDYLKFRRVSNKQLAEDVTRLLRERGYNFRCSESTIAFLRSEKKAARWTCRPETADAIETVLNVPPGSLFAVHILGTSPSDKRGAA